MLRPPPLGAGVSTEAARTIAASGSPCSGFRVSGFGFRVSGFGFRIWGLGFSECLIRIAG